MKKTTFILIFSIVITSAFGQAHSNDTLSFNPKNNFSYKELILPTAFVGYGVLALNNQKIKDFDTTLKDKFDPNRSKIQVEDFLALSPTLTVYGLNFIGIESKNNFWDRTIIIGTASAMMLTAVYGTKFFVDILRPDNSTYNSFPSGHTAATFMGAEFLYQEYKNRSIVYGMAGYSVAGLTGFLRMYNSRHWFSDVVAGAGIGILSTKISYLIYPYLKEKLFFHKLFNNKEIAGVILPYYNGQNYGLTMSLNF